MRQPFSRDERQRLLASRTAALRLYSELMDRVAECVPGSAEESAAVAAADVHFRAAAQAEAEYFRGLPRIAVSCCPFDGKPLYRTIDPDGLDGLWWRSDAAPVEPPSCPHFCLLRGALSSKAAGPSVIARILGKPSMIAVLSQVEAAPGVTAYLTAYFAERRPPVQELAANWPRSLFLYTTALGRHNWRLDDEVSDADLSPWDAQGRIRRCAPDSGNERLSDP